jgi:hypothetical protein
MHGEAVKFTLALDYTNPSQIVFTMKVYVTVYPGYTYLL